jgi:hypothetical protein
VTTKTTIGACFALLLVACAGGQVEPSVTHRAFDARIGGFSGTLYVACTDGQRMTNDTRAEIVGGKIYAEHAVGEGWEYDVVPDTGVIATLHVDLYCAKEG